jgi:hypothetical protein
MNSLSASRLGAVLLLTVLNGCTGAVSEPYYLGRWTSSEGGKVEVGLGIKQNDPLTGRPNFSVCYSRLTHTPAQVRALVQKHCGDPQMTFNATDLYSCSLAAPVRTTYSCSALSRTAEEARPNLIRSDSSLGTIDLY